MSARSRIATRRAAAELAGHRRRLLECAVDSADLDPADALLLRVEPTAHEAGLLRVAQAALAVAEDSHLTQPKSPARDSRPPISETRPSAEPELDPAASFFTPTVNKTSPLNSAPSLCRTAAGVGEAAAPRIRGGEGELATASLLPTDLQLNPSSGRIAGREGEGQAPSNPTTASDLSRWGEGTRSHTTERHPGE